MVSGLVANLRANPIMNVRTPAEVKAKILALSRPIKTRPDPGGTSVNVVWNAQDKLSVCVVLKRGGPFDRRADDDTCPLPGGGSGGGGSGGGSDESVPKGPPVTFTSGPPGPTCTSGCGELCTGAYCILNPTGIPGDFD